jgi:phosphatidylinositol-3-phosphatase
MRIILRASSFICSLIFVLILQITHPGKAFSQVTLPCPDHIVVAFLENHGFSQIIGYADASHINALAVDEFSALFTQSYGVEHPSQPNYIDFFSGFNQGVNHDSIPPDHPFTTPNLGYQLIASGRSFLTFSENLPYEGFNGANNDNYQRKHNPVANWMGTGINQVSTATNQPLTAFPSNNFASLPTVCFVVPTQLNDMHCTNEPGCIATGDNWIYDHLNSYIQWAKTHNSLFILTFDEDNDVSNNRIVTIFTGQKVKGGEYSETINHFSVLRTIEDMYGLPYAGAASSATPITDCWDITHVISESGNMENQFSVFPNPAAGGFSIRLNTATAGSLKNVEIYNSFGDKVFEQNTSAQSNRNLFFKDYGAGIYFVKVWDGKTMDTKKLVIQ